MDVVAENRRLAARLGWRPPDWGHDRFDLGLAERIRAFQIDRVLPVTGLSDHRTYRVLLDYNARRAELYRELNRNRYRIRQGSRIMAPAKDTPKLNRAEVFEGVLVDADDAILRDLDPRRVDGAVVPVHELRAFTSMTARRRGLRVLALLDAGVHDPAEALATVRRYGCAGLIVHVGPEFWERAVADRAGAPIRSILYHVRRRPRIPLAVRWAAVHRGTKSFETWRSMRGFDAMMPVVPGPGFRGVSVEHALGYNVALWWGAIKVRAWYCLPWLDMNDPRAQSPDYIRRFRAWLRDRGYRTTGFAGYNHSRMHREACFSALPSYVPRFDGVFYGRAAEPHRATG